MTNAYYIEYKNTSSGIWYKLIVRDTHYCISCGNDLEKILECLKKSVKRNRRKERLLRELRGLESGGRPSPSTYSQREEWYRIHGKDYEDLVHSTVLEALHEAVEEDKENSPLRKTTNRLKKVGKLNSFPRTIEEMPIEDSTTTKDSSKILRKPRVFNRK